MISPWVLLYFIVFVQGISNKDATNPFNRLIADVLTNCPQYKTVILYGDYKDEIVRLVMENHKKIQLLSGTIESIAMSPIELLVIFLDPLEGWNRQLAGRFLGINTVFIVTERLDLNQARMIFTDFWNSSESTNVFVCSESDGGKNVEMFTHNPYNNYAPSSFWSRLNGQQIYFGRYSAGRKKNIVLDMLFDRTKHLENYPIQAQQFVRKFIFDSLESNYLISSKSSTPREIRLFNTFLILDSLIHSLKVSVNLTSLLKKSNPIDTELLVQQSHLKLVDMTIQPTILLNMSLLSIYDIMHPIYFTSEVIVTHHRGLMTPLEKMFNFYGWLTISATAIIISAAFLVIYLSSNLPFAVFESLRLIVNAAIQSRMESIKSRIFFSMIFLYFLIIQATFSGHLAAFLTKPQYRKNVENLEDLMDPNYVVIYANEQARTYITDQALLAKTVFGTSNCNTDTMINSRAACIESISSIMYLIAAYNLHYTKRAPLNRYIIFLLRKNWRLKDRINQVMLRLVDSGLTNRKRPHIGWKHKRIMWKLQEPFMPDYYRPIELTDLQFIFLVLGVGLFMGLLVFLGELSNQGWKKHQREIRKRWRAGERAVKVIWWMVVIKTQRWFRKP